MAVESDAIGHAKRARLADIVQQNAQRQRRRWRSQAFQHDQRVRPDVALGMKLRRLRHAFHRGHFRQDVGQQSGSVQQFEPAPRAAFGQDANQFVANPFGRNAQNLGVQLLDGGQGSGFDFETEARRETHGAEHPQMVFFKALLRIADGADRCRRGDRPGRRRNPRLGNTRKTEEYEEFKNAGSSSSALMVKSRRSTSCLGSVSNTTARDGGRRHRNDRCGKSRFLCHPPAPRRTARPPVEPWETAAAARRGARRLRYHSPSVRAPRPDRARSRRPARPGSRVRRSSDPLAILD